MQKLDNPYLHMLTKARRKPAQDGFDRVGRQVAGRFQNAGALWRRLSAQRIARSANSHAPVLGAMDDAALDEVLIVIRTQLVDKTSFAKSLPMALAIIREKSRRLLGMAHHHVQLMGGAAMIGGAAIEMRTGEGKTLVALLPACIAALRGQPVHLVTTNDYLAARDEAELRPVYRSLGLTSGCIQHGQDRATRAEIYGRNVVYGSNKEFAFDYLRDRVAMRGFSATSARLREAIGTLPEGPLMATRMALCIVDEADSVLIDEARVPLILSRTIPFEDEDKVYRSALEIARQCVQGTDFRRENPSRTIELTPTGQRKVDDMTNGWTGIWQSRPHRADVVAKALHALHILQCDVHYILQDGKVALVDEFTGRILDGRSWSDGLQQLVELKEGLTPTAPTIPAGSITFQRFFSAYPAISGMSGTLSNIATELAETYDMPVVRIPTHHRSRQKRLPTTVMPDLLRKIEAIAARAAEVSGKGQPVLVGCRSVRASEALSQALDRHGVRHQVLTAAQDAHEADIIAAAGQTGRVTVATNMAGRGTDIRLDEVARQRGGLHVIITEKHESRRIDRQLQGRCARQGDPGTTETIVSLQDELAPRLFRSGKLSALASLLCQSRIGQFLADQMIDLSQRAVERRHRRMRARITQMDVANQQMMSFAGEWE